MPLYEGGPLTQFTAFNAGVIPNDVFGVAINWFVNRTPLISRLPKLPTGSPQFLVTNDNYRPRSNPMNNGGVLTSAATSVVVSDGSIFDIGDVIQIEQEYLLVTGTPDPARTRQHADHHPRLRRHDGRQPQRPAAGLPRHQHPHRRRGERHQRQPDSPGGHPVLPDRAARLPGRRRPPGRHQLRQRLCHPARPRPDAGDAACDGRLRERLLLRQGRAAVVYDKPAADEGHPEPDPDQQRLRRPPTRRPTSPATWSATRSRLASTAAATRRLLVVSTDFLSGFAVWGHAAMRLHAGSNVFGTPIDLFEAPFLSGISIIPAPLLRPGTAICLSDPEVRIRLKRPMIDKPRGSRGDAFEGDIIMEGAIELDNEAHHAFVTGVTAFAAA